MADIFHGAHLTIAASAAGNSHEGCFITQPPRPALKFHVAPKIEDGSSGLIDNGGILYVQTDWGKDQHVNDLELSPIQQRGWIFQEMLLSRRVVHFGAKQCYWQCHCLLESEDLSVPHPDRQFRQRPNNGSADFNVWWILLKEHWCRQLTFTSDFLPSLAGPVAWYQRLSVGDEPVIGMWRRKLAVHLLWFTETPWRDSARDPTHPSWSWTVARDPHENNSGSFPSFSHMLQNDGELEILWMAEVAEVDIVWAGRPMVSELEQASLVLTKASWQKGVEWNVKGSSQPSLLSSCSYMYAKYDCRGESDFLGDPPPPGSTDILLWVGLEGGRHTRQPRLWWYTIMVLPARPRNSRGTLLGRGDEDHSEGKPV
ncbi:hypothetical protein B0H66DRAFT_603720 [Apodospora peruviana]|uniref:Heterokaryon incompatibility domain-containing protein n=1 Tax=Apodospora peruviana TaxID=516989 RepID=A0AAE0M581_9PEZI|nr:hypothetical protein B0H66DRAFT_603720 [Apodospora peruviana]